MPYLKTTPVVVIIVTVLSFSCGHKSGRKDKDELPKHLSFFQSSDKNREISVSGKVIAVVDGDTYDILIRGNKTLRVRMEGIDAPERGMPFYQKSKKHLSDLCFGKQIKIKITGDDGPRVLAYSYLDDGSELSQEMIRAGLAWHFKKYNSDTILANLELEARSRKNGIWNDKNPMPPWENRRLHREGISTKDSFRIEEINR